MVSNANEDLPDPDKPVKTIRASRGSSRVRFLRLCSRAPWMTRESVPTAPECTGGPGHGSDLQVRAFQTRRSLATSAVVTPRLPTTVLEKPITVAAPACTETSVASSDEPRSSSTVPSPPPNVGSRLPSFATLQTARLRSTFEPEKPTAMVLEPLGASGTIPSDTPT